MQAGSFFFSFFFQASSHTKQKKKLSEKRHMFGKQHQKSIIHPQNPPFSLHRPCSVATCTEELAMNQSYSRARFIAIRPYSVATCVLNASSLPILQQIGLLHTIILHFRCALFRIDVRYLEPKTLQTYGFPIQTIILILRCESKILSNFYTCSILCAHVKIMHPSSTQSSGHYFFFFST